MADPIGDVEAAEGIVDPSSVGARGPAVDAAAVAAIENARCGCCTSLDPP